ARAAEPILPECEVPTSTTFT
ncbi:hypothetical protein D030_4118B, partial [Vibrio parahaemolyticus AQ3810]